MTEESIIKEMLRRVLSNQKILMKSLQFDPNLSSRGIEGAIKETKKVLRRSLLCPNRMKTGPE
jgi:hypothetical protein